MNFIEGVAVSNLCDYSFGDQAGCIGNVVGSFMKQADSSNEEFISVYTECKRKGKKIMTLFIDNIRLYARHIQASNEEDQKWINGLHETNDLLKMCSSFEDMNFIIFTNLEDTPLTEDIHMLIPDNVIAIHAVNALSFGGKVFPFPYGLQRILHPTDNRIGILHEAIKNKVKPKKLLYINHAEHTNLSERGNIREMFGKYKYVTVDERMPYDLYCNQIQNHKFMICPQGNGVDCHRNWEVLYLKRVPVMKRSDYLQELYQKFPVLWVDDYAQVTKTLLLENENLFEQAQNLDSNLLNLYSVFNRLVRNGKNKIA